METTPMTVKGAQAIRDELDNLKYSLKNSQRTGNSLVGLWYQFKMIETVINFVSAL